MTLAHDLKLCGGSLHPVATSTHHGVEQIPAVIREQFEQPFIHRSDGHFASVRWGLAIDSPHRHPDQRSVADPVSRPVRGHPDHELMLTPANLDFRHPEFEGWPAKVYHGRRLDATDSTAYCQDRNVHVWRKRLPDRYLEYGLLSRKRNHKTVES